MLRVLNINMEWRYAGPHVFILNLVKELRAEGVEIIVIAPIKSSNYFIKELRRKGIELQLLNLHVLTKDKLQLLKYFIFFIPEVFNIYKYIIKSRVDIVNCHHSWQIKGVLAAKLARKPVVWTMHDSYMPTLVKSIFKLISVLFSDAFISTGYRTKEYYFKDTKKKSKRIINISSSVDVSKFDPENVLENQYIASLKGLKLIMVSNITPVKGIEYFIEAASILNEKYKDLNFLLVGKQFKSQKKYFYKLIKRIHKLHLNNFHFWGSSFNIASILKAADITILSSISESSPICVWEYMSMAKPIVSTDVGDVARFIKNWENGFVVPIKDPVTLSEKISILIKDEELRKRFGAKARETAIRYLDVSICAKKHAEFYKEVLRSKGILNNE